jgi:hypothetical protein
VRASQTPSQETQAAEQDPSRGERNPEKKREAFGSPSSQRKTGLKVSAFRFIEAEKASHSVALLCRILGV